MKYLLFIVPTHAVEKVHFLCQLCYHYWPYLTCAFIGLGLGGLHCIDFVKVYVFIIKLQLYQFMPAVTCGLRLCQDASHFPGSCMYLPSWCGLTKNIWIGRDRMGKERKKYSGWSKHPCFNFSKSKLVSLFCDQSFKFPLCEKEII